MPETPGQVCYEAFWAQVPFRDWRSWGRLTAHEKARWEGAAQAVLAQWQGEQARLGAPGWLVEGPSTP